MISSIKEKFSKATKNGKDHHQSAEVDLLSLGRDFLSSFQKHWVTLHILNENNAAEAEKLSESIKDNLTKINHNKDNIIFITNFLNSQFSNNINNCLMQLNDLHETCKKVESDLDNLEDLIEDVELSAIKEKHEYHLKQYELRKQESIKKFEESLEESYNQKLESYDLRNKKVLTERQQVFQEAFKTDLKTFKDLGTIPKISQTKPSSALLEEIVLDYDQNELEQFFEDEVIQK